MAEKKALEGAGTGAAAGASFGPWGALIGGVAGGLMGAGVSEGDDSTAKQAAANMYNELLSIGAPPDTAQALVLEKFKSAGQLTPKLEEYIQQGPSQTAAITEDPALKEKQMSALNLLSQRASGGLNPEDRAKYNEIREQLAKEQNAKQQQIIQNYQARGMGGSGAELQAALMNQQSGANQASSEGDRLAATASQNALQAALQSGQLGGQIRQQDFDVNKTKASAADEMNRFNTQNKTNQQARNVASQNQAQQYNLTNAQNIQNSNTSMANQETNRENEAKLTDWGNKVKLAQIRAGNYQTQANDFKGRAQATRDQYGQIGGALGTAAQLYASQPKKSSSDDEELSLAHGGMVPGNAKFPGDHPANDTVPAHLSPGELVLPRSIMTSHDPGDVAKKFVQYVQALNKKPEYKYGKDSK